MYSFLLLSIQVRLTTSHFGILAAAVKTFAGVNVKPSTTIQ